MPFSSIFALSVHLSHQISMNVPAELMIVTSMHSALTQLVDLIVYAISAIKAFTMAATVQVRFLDQLNR